MRNVHTEGGLTMRIKIDLIALRNFKGATDKKYTFGEVTNVYGANGSGKTRLFDAFLWLLFGKDHLDRKDYEVKSYGRANAEDECSVEAVLEIDGKPTTLKRALVEDWVKPRGQAEKVYKGNHTECWWNGTPVKVGEYAKKVSELVTEDLFKMITNPHHFTALNWKVQREMLFRMAEVRSDMEIASERAEFAELAEVLSGKTLEDWSKELRTQKQLLKRDLEGIAPKIAQVDKMRPEVQDWDALQQQLAATEDEIGKIDLLLADRMEAQKAAAKEYDAKLADMRVERVQIQEQIEKLVSDAKKDEWKRVKDANEERVKLSSQLSKLQSEQQVLSADAEHAGRQVIAYEGEIEEMDRKLAALRQEWQERAAQEYTESTCPTCGQIWPLHIAASKQETFNRRKAADLEALNAKGKALNADKAVLEGKQRAAQEKAEEKKMEAESLSVQIDNLSSQISQMQTEQPREIAEDMVEGVLELKAKVQAIDEAYNELIKNHTTPSAPEKELNRKRDLLQKRDDLKAELVKKKFIAKCDEEIASLRAEEKSLAQNLADLEKSEYTIQLFTQAKIDEAERKINALFSVVSFKLFDKTIEGNPVETCEAMVLGRPYGTINNASQINAGLDIIRTLSKAYDVYAPIFIDNRESVTYILPMETQIINLVVSENDTELRITTN